MSAVSVPGQQLLAFVERIERLAEERKTIADDIAEVLKEAAATGFNKKHLKRVVKIRETGIAGYLQEDSELTLYLAALGMLPSEEPVEAWPASSVQVQARAMQARTRENIEEFGSDAGISGAGACSSLAAREADESAVFNPQRLSSNDEASPEVGLQAEASHAGTGSGTLADRESRIEGEAAVADLPANSSSPPEPLPAADATGGVSPPLGLAGRASSARSANPGAADGQRSIPSSEAGGAKMEQRPTAEPDRDAKGHDANSEQAVPDFEPPAFLVKSKGMEASA